MITIATFAGSVMGRRCEPSVPGTAARWYKGGKCPCRYLKCGREISPVGNCIGAICHIVDCTSECRLASHASSFKLVWDHRHQSRVGGCGQDVPASPRSVVRVAEAILSTKMLVVIQAQRLPWHDSSVPPSCMQNACALLTSYRRQIGCPLMVFFSSYFSLVCCPALRNSI